MGYLIGTDEAGYGPNLGPLVISTTVWEAPDEVDGETLSDRLAHLIATNPSRVDANGGPYVAMADSKKLYASGKGVRHLERGLWAAMGLLDRHPKKWSDVWPAIAPESLDPMSAIPWYVGYEESMPREYDDAGLESLVGALRAGLAAVGVRLAAVRSRVIFVEEFNALVDRHGSKGAALSQQTLALAARMMKPLGPGPISLVCDKHGGRNRYGALLAEHFPEWLIEVRGEGRERSSYRFGPPERRVNVCFRTKAEACLPVALASMASKYLRELAMRALNEYWSRRVPGLCPTAGYPLDAKRFRADIAHARKQLSIPDRVLWRSR